MHHISGTVKHIMIFGSTLVLNDGISKYFFIFLKVH